MEVVVSDDSGIGARKEHEIERYKLVAQMRDEQDKTLRAEILDLLKATQSMEIYAVLGLGAYYAWVFSRCLPTLDAKIVTVGFVIGRVAEVLPWILPALIPIFGYWRTRHSINGVFLI